MLTAIAALYVILPALYALACVALAHLAPATPRAESSATIVQSLVALRTRHARRAVLALRVSLAMRHAVDAVYDSDAVYSETLAASDDCMADALRERRLALACNALLRLARAAQRAVQAEPQAEPQAA